MWYFLSKSLCKFSPHNTWTCGQTRPKGPVDWGIRLQRLNAESPTQCEGLINNLCRMLAMLTDHRNMYLTMFCMHWVIIADVRYLKLHSLDSWQEAQLCESNASHKQMSDPDWIHILEFSHRTSISTHSSDLYSLRFILKSAYFFKSDEVISLLFST